MFPKLIYCLYSIRSTMFCDLLPDGAVRRRDYIREFYISVKTGLLRGSRLGWGGWGFELTISLRYEV